MGIWRAAWGWLNATPTVAFSESAPRPIDQLIVDMMGRGATPAVGRAEALSVPAVQRGRNLICSVATLPLVQRGPLREVAENPLFQQLDSDVPNVVTLAQTLEDLVFDAVAWWRITAFGWDGYPTSIRRLDPGAVSLNAPAGSSPAPLPSGLDPHGAVVWVNGKPVPASEMIRFDSPNPAVLKVGGRAIRRAILLDRAASTYADDPQPAAYFTPAEGADPADDDDVRDMLNDWKRARKERSTAYVPAALKYNSVPMPSPRDLQLVELQKQAALEIANAFGVDPEDLGVSTTSRTYANVIDRRRDRINDVLAPYMRAITDRLSMRDVTKRGYTVEFQLDNYLKSNPTERWSVYKTAKDLGAMTVEEIREAEGWADLPAGAAEPTPAPEPAPVPEQVAASTQAGMTFDRQSAVTFDAELVSFSVDTSARTIEGLALPYGKTANKFGQAFRFERGSLQWKDPGRVKLLRDHDYRQAIGRAVSLTDTPAGLKVQFKVARGEEGDRALALAEDGVLDGMSVGVDFELSADTVPDPKSKGAVLVRRADLREVSLTAAPAFDDARVSKVAASRDEGDPGMPEQEIEAQPQTTPPAPGGFTLTAEQFDQLLRRTPAEQPEPEVRPTVNPTRLTASVSEPLPYRFDRGGNFVPTEHVFSADLHSMALANDQDGTQTDAGKRVMDLLQATFATTPTGNVTDLNPTIQRPDMYVDQRDYRTPLWDAISKGAPPNGVNPFRFPKFSAASGLVGDHTEGTEPTSGSYTATGQTVTPTALSGKASITREVWDMGGNPAVSTLVFKQMVRGWSEGLESATATFLNTLTAATDVSLGTAATDAALSSAWDAALADLQFIRGYDFSVFVMEKELYKKFAGARDSSNRPLYPILSPMNANGTSAARFRTLDLSGVTGIPSWALASTAGSPNNSWLLDPSTVHGWASAPTRLEFPGTSSTGTYAPVAMVDIAIWGYKAFANSDIAGVRQVIYDTV